MREWEAWKRSLVYTEYMLSSGRSPQSSPVLSVYVHSLKTKEKYIAMALKKIQNQTKTPPSCDKYLEWLQLYSFVTHPDISAYWNEPTTLKHTQTNSFKGWPTWLCIACSSGSMAHDACACGNLATVNIHSQGFIWKIKEWEHLLYCIYIIVYVGILRKI